MKTLAKDASMLADHLRRHWSECMVKYRVGRTGLLGRDPLVHRYRCCHKTETSQTTMDTAPEMEADLEGIQGAEGGYDGLEAQKEGKSRGGETSGEKV